MLSIIIPTLNEEDYLPLLLKSIKEQDFLDYEIIVADAGSTDKTLEIAKKYGCSIAQGGLPARGRNNGAKVAQGNQLFFLDADTILPDIDFLKKSFEEFNARNLGIASFRLEYYPQTRLSRFMLKSYNKIIVMSEKVWPFAAVGIIVTKELFTKLGGYDEQIKLSEDYDLARRALQYASFGIIKSEKILVSSRRFTKEGWVKTVSKLMVSEFHNIFIGPVKSDIFNYQFGHYKEDKKKD